MRTRTGSRVWGLCVKELRVRTRRVRPLWIAGLFQGAMLLWLFWVNPFFQRGVADFYPFFRVLVTFFSFLLPLHTAGSFEEEKEGTGELLYSYPVSTLALVLAKLCPPLLMLLVHMVQVLGVLLALSPYGEFDGGAILGGCAGLLLYGTMVLCAGMGFSIIGQGVVRGYAFSCAANLFLLLLPLGRVPFLRFFSITHRLEGFFRGIIYLKEVSFFLGVGIIWVFLSAYALEARRWK